MHLAPRRLLQLYDRLHPALAIPILLQEGRRIDHHGVPLAPERVPVHAAGGTTREKGTIRLKGALMLRALEASLLLLPAQGGALVRAREAESIHPVLVPGEDDLVLPVDGRAILLRDRIDSLAVSDPERRGDPDRELEGKARGDTQRSGTGGHRCRLA
jgi:hypothetical protein